MPVTFLHSVMMDTGEKLKYFSGPIEGRRDVRTPWSASGELKDVSWAMEQWVYAGSVGCCLWGSCELQACWGATER